MTRAAKGKNREPLGPGDESVWDYPRPPRVEESGKHVQVFFAGELVGASRRALRVLETSHPPVYYLPPEDVRLDFLTRTEGRSFCEFKGSAAYWTLRAGGQTSADAAWSYPDPARGFETLRDHLAFYPSRVSECFVGGERVGAQAGDFYGGWITAEIKGPFKGGAGTWGW